MHIYFRKNCFWSLFLWRTPFFIYFKEKKSFIVEKDFEANFLGFCLIWTLCSFKSYFVHIYSSKCGEGTRSLREKWEPCHAIMVLFILRKLILQTRMCSYPVGLDVWFLVGPFIYFHTSCVQTVKALVRLHGCTGSPEPSLVAYVISTIISLRWHKFSILF